MTSRDALRQRVMDALDSSEARCGRFPDGLACVGGCDSLDGCEDCLRLAADAVLRVLSDAITPMPADAAELWNLMRSREQARTSLENINDTLAALAAWWGLLAPEMEGRP